MSCQRVVSVVSLALVLLVASAAQADRAVRPVVTSAGMDFQVSEAHGALTLKVSTPGGAVVQRSFRAGEPVSFSLFDAKGGRMADGEYRWEIVAAPRSAATRTADGVSGKASAGGWTESGAFLVADGAILPGEAVEPAHSRPAEKVQDPGNKDQVIPDDLIVQGSLCVGFDCVNNESFGFDTIRLKENNTRIKFEDTSAGTFPTNDWQLTANDSASGASSKFSIEDITGARVPFTIRAGAATNSIFVDSTGRLGLRTSTPVLDLHINTSNTPSIRLEQNNSGGFTAQTWDIAGNEANFFVRDVTGGSRLPFRIRPGAPTSSIDISADGDVGIGTASPSASLHVSRSDGTAQVKVTETSGTGAGRTLFNLENNGQVKFRMKDTAQVAEWVFTASNAFQIDNLADAGVELQINPDGALFVNGTQMIVPDYVFDPDYELLPLTELGVFVAENRHLPNVPTAADIKRDGLNLSAFPIRLLEKIEELTLYTIDQHERIEGLTAQNAELKARLAAIEERLAQD